MNRLLISFFSLVFLLFIASNCALQKNELDKELKLELVTSQSHGGYKNEQYRAITNLEELKSIYTQLNLTRKPGLPLPNVNFEKESVITLFMGQKMSGGFSIKIDSIKRITKNQVEVQLKRTQPKEMASMAITSPLAIYKVNIPNVEIMIKK